MRPHSPSPLGEGCWDLRCCWIEEEEEEEGEGASAASLYGGGGRSVRRRGLGKNVDAVSSLARLLLLPLEDPPNPPLLLPTATKPFGRKKEGGGEEIPGVYGPREVTQQERRKAKKKKEKGLFPSVCRERLSHWLSSRSVETATAMVSVTFFLFLSPEKKVPRYDPTSFLLLLLDFGKFMNALGLR